VADGWCWFVLREEYCCLVAGGWFVLREKYCWLVADKPSEQAASEDIFFRFRPSEDIYNYTYTKVIIPRPSYSIVQRAIEASFTPVT
jgi:hypothetical protein